eukprot:TRINITY_DN9288_c0_g1_i1.p1 TRINITY_DN9288_c0_g1~~TRINITY_DN9288_c0_g1_i1.p1  ORF type:complete len:312 (+),score=113.39 TRINITY_DN9288_c0_g1_i1:11-946(+)
MTSRSPIRDRRSSHTQDNSYLESRKRERDEARYDFSRIWARSPSPQARSSKSSRNRDRSADRRDRSRSRDRSAKEGSRDRKVGSRDRSRSKDRKDRDRSLSRSRKDHKKTSHRGHRSDSSDSDKKRSKKSSKSKKSKKSKKAKKSHKKESSSSSDSGSDSEVDEKQLELMKQMWEEKKRAEGSVPEPLQVGPIQLKKVEIETPSYGGAMMPGEADAIAQYVQANKRIPRRGEVGITSEEIESYENLGYVMSGSRHKRMNAVRLRKENQVYSAEEQRALAMFNYEEKAKRENSILADFREMLAQKNAQVSKK